MQYTNHYQSPLGEILLASDGTALTGLWFVERQKHFAQTLDEEHEEKSLPLFASVKSWLDRYFVGKEPHFTPPLRFTGTDFQQEVQKILCTIPYGQTMTYGEIAAPPYPSSFLATVWWAQTAVRQATPEALTEKSVFLSWKTADDSVAPPFFASPLASELLWR